MKRKQPIKDCVVALRCDHATKERLENMASSLDISVSHLVLRLIQAGTRLERERRAKLMAIIRGDANGAA
jgi:hypothetical protein